MNQTGFAKNKTLVLKPKGFAFVVGLCIFSGVYGLFSRSVLWLLPIGKTLPSQLSAHSLFGIIQALNDTGLLLGCIYVLKKQNWARLLILVAAVAKILDWLYGAIVYRWLFSVLSLVIWSLPSLFIAVVIVIYFCRPSVKAYMD